MFDVIETEKSLLLISENPKITNLLDNLLSADYACETALSVNEAFAKLRENDYWVILCSANLPSIDALEMIRHVQTVSPNTVMILLGDENANDSAVKAFRAGVFDFLRIPAELDDVKTAVERAAEHHEMKILKDNYQFHLESLAAERATEIDKALEADNKFVSAYIGKSLIQQFQGEYEAALAVATATRDEIRSVSAG